jgi:hypothetical protein
MIRAATLVLTLSACSPLPDHVVGAWDRIYTNGTPIPAGTLDRLTFTIEGHATKERDGRTERGSWSGGDLSQYTLSFPPADITTWSARQAACPDVPAPPCLVLENATATDWYRGNFALLTAL